MGYDCFSVLPFSTTPSMDETYNGKYVDATDLDVQPSLDFILYIQPSLSFNLNIELTNG